MLPKGIVSSGFPRVRETCRMIGIEFDPWETDLNKCILAKTADGLHAADTVGMSIARQVGKTFDVGAVSFAECIAEPGTTVVWTAHRFKVSRETFNELRALAKTPKLKPHIDFDAITTAAGNECIPFRNGSRIVFAARERGAIRGFTKVRILILDEAQILTDSALSDLVPTMNQATNPLIILMGTPPKPSDPSEVFTNLRTDALAGVSEGVLWVEIGAKPDADLDDRQAWREANPSYPTRTPARAILRMRKLLSTEDFAREALGIWDGQVSAAAIPAGVWESLTDPDEDAPPLRRQSFAVEVDKDRAFASIGSAATRADGRRHLEVERHRGTKWIVQRAKDLDAKHGPALWGVDGGGPAASLIEDLEAEGLNVVTLGLADVAAACAALVDDMNDPQPRTVHGPQPELEEAVRGSRKRSFRDGGFTFGRAKSETDVTPLLAVTLAAWLAAQPAPTSAYESRSLMTV